MTDIVGKKYGLGVTTEHIFDEVLGVVMRKTEKRNAIEIGEAILMSEIHMLHVDHLILSQSWVLFKENHLLSFTDCTSLQLAKRHGIEFIATFDKAFKDRVGITVVDS